MRDLDGKTLTNVVKIDGDPSGLRAIDKAMQAQRKQWEKKPVTSRFDLDDTSFNEKIHRLSNQIKRTAGQTEAFVKKSQKSVADSLQDSLSRMRSARALYDKEATGRIPQADHAHQERARRLRHVRGGHRERAQTSGAVDPQPSRCQ